MREFRRILAPVDFSDATPAGLRPARRLAEALEADLFLLHVIEFPHESIATERLYLEVEDAAGSRLDDLAEGLGLERERLHRVVLRGVPYDAITRFADEQNIDLIVMPTHRRAGLDRLVFGSVAERVLRMAHCPVMAVPPTIAEEFAPGVVLFGTDFSDTARAAFDEAVVVARSLGCPLAIAHVSTLAEPDDAGSPWQFPMVPPAVEEAEAKRAEGLLHELEGTAAGDDLKVSTHLLRGTNPPLELAELSATLRAGLIVVASHGHSGITRALLGSTSEKLVRISPVPVMVVRPAEE